MSTKAKGSAFETATVKYLRDRGWVAWRILPSTNELEGARGRGVADVIALRGDKHHFRVRLIECKATKGPFSSFVPAQREALLAVRDEIRGCYSLPGVHVEALLAWKRPRQRAPVFIPSRDWPAREEQ